MPTGTRNAKVAIGGDTTGLDRALGRSKQSLSRFGRDVKSELGGAVRGAFSGLASVAGFTGLGSLALGARETKLFNDRLVALQQTTGFTRTKILAMNAGLQETALRTGVLQTELLAGVEKFQEVTGEADKFVVALDDMANVSTATNAKMSDIAATSAAASQLLGVTSKDLLRMFDILATQGDKGAVELKNLATMMPQLAAAAARFKTQGVEGVAEWGAAIQVIRHGTGTAEEALTQLVDLSASLLTHWKKLEAGGVKVFSDKEHKKTRDFLEIVDEIAQKIPRSRLSDTAFLGQRKEALFAFDAIVKFRKELAALATTQDKVGAITRKNADFNASSTKQFNQALALLHKTANDLFMDALPKLAGAFQTVAGALKWMVDHQAEVLAMLIAWKSASIAIGLASAGAGAGSLAARVALPAVAAAATSGVSAATAAGAGAAAGGGLAALGTTVFGGAAALAGGFAGGLLLHEAADTSGNRALGRINPAAAAEMYSDFSLRRRYLEEAHRGRSATEIYAEAAPGGMTAMEEKRFQRLIHMPGTAERFYPGDPGGLAGGAKPGESAADYVARQNAEMLRPLVGALIRLVHALENGGPQQRRAP